MNLRFVFCVFCVFEKSAIRVGERARVGEKRGRAGEKKGRVGEKKGKV